MRVEFDALAATWERLAAEDARFGSATAVEDQERVEALLESLEDVELALIGAPAECDRHAAVKLRIIGRAIMSGADAGHVAHVFDAARADLLRFPAATAARARP
jgi:hypothetical protein